MGGKLVLTRLCHGLTPAVQLLEKLFYLHTLNDLFSPGFLFIRTRSTGYYIRHLPYSSLHTGSCFPVATHILKRERERERKRVKLNRKVARIQSPKSQELVEHFSLNYINIYIHNNSSNTIILSRHYLFFVFIFRSVSLPSLSHSSKMKCE